VDSSCAFPRRHDLPELCNNCEGVSPAPPLPLGHSVGPLQKLSEDERYITDRGKMFTLQINTNDIISIAALVVAILFGIGNLVYTRRTFIASVYPLAQMTPDVRMREEPRMAQGEGVYKIYVGLRNLSDSVRLTKISANVKIENYKKGWKLWQRGWLPFTYGSSNVVEPGLYTHIATDNIIEILLLERFPELIRKVEIPRPDVAGTRNLTYYTPIDLRPLKIRVTVRYTPAISGVKSRTITGIYELSPNPQLTSAFPDPLYDWRITEVP